METGLNQVFYLYARWLIEIIKKNTFVEKTDKSLIENIIKKNNTLCHHLENITLKQYAVPSH